MTPDDLRKVWELPVRADPRDDPADREFSLGMLGDATHLDVSARNPSAVRGLLAQRDFIVTGIETIVVHGIEAITRVTGRLPVGCLRIGSRRRDGYPCRIFARQGGREIAARTCCIDTGSGAPIGRDGNGDA